MHEAAIDRFEPRGPRALVRCMTCTRTTRSSRTIDWPDDDRARVRQPVALQPRTASTSSISSADDILVLRRPRASTEVDRWEFYVVDRGLPQWARRLPRSTSRTSDLRGGGLLHQHLPDPWTIRCRTVELMGVARVDLQPSATSTSSPSGPERGHLLRALARPQEAPTACTSEVGALPVLDDRSRGVGALESRRQAFAGSSRECRSKTSSNGRDLLYIYGRPATPSTCYDAETFEPIRTETLDVRRGSDVVHGAGRVARERRRRGRQPTCRLGRPLREERGRPRTCAGRSRTRAPTCRRSSLCWW